MRKSWVCISLALLTGLVWLAGCGVGQTPALTATHAAPQRPTAVTEPAGWKLVFQDEFDGPAGVQPAQQNWNYDTGGSGWDDAERQYYTTAAENAVLDGNGMLKITALKAANPSKSGLTCWYGACAYTSARLVTRGRYNLTFGRVEARLRLPAGQGIGPGFWLQGADSEINPWPANGEIDVALSDGKDPAGVQAGIAGPGYSGAGAIRGVFKLSAGSFSDDYHVFAVEWDPEEIRWYGDGQQYFALTPDKAPGKWVFDHRFYLGLSLAVGGSERGDPGQAVSFPQAMSVDYVRVFQRTE